MIHFCIIYHRAKLRMSSYQPPLTISSRMLHLVTDVGDRLARLRMQAEQEHALRLRRINRIRTIQGSLAIEGNTLSEEQITAIIEGKRIIAPPRDIQEALNAIRCYGNLSNWRPVQEEDLLTAHRMLMAGLLPDAGHYRHGGVGVMNGKTVIHMAPPAERVSLLIRQLLHWLKGTDLPPLIASCLFHYEFEFIHPFADGNGRMGRLWQTLILSRWEPLFANVPVESLVHDNQPGYYQALNTSNQQSDCAPFVEFMLGMILRALEDSLTPQVSPQVTPQVAELLAILQGAMSREEIQHALQLQDRKSFSERYLRPALNAQLIEMTLPDKPNSRLQKYRLTPEGETLRRRQ
ncbi:Fic family protein [Serratia quinivorans]|uniref:Fic family protein n=1 Tax=Serratia quinivorans TaxID=137545 RepID=UPI002177C1E6|nr:Fic family protein [Serratia quinivorans]CAI1138505.1 Protein involved in cell division [Serratia quinivorans]CAI2129830.1 Protein involved in cell division [Serratia quinivorans]